MKKFSFALLLLSFPLILFAESDFNTKNYSSPIAGVGGWGGDTPDIEVSIVAAKESTQEIKVIDKKEIEKTNAVDTISLLQESLHLTVTQYGAYGNDASVNLRGFDSGRVAILVDGVPVNSAVTGGFNFNTIDPSSIERIEVIYGGSDTRYNVSGSLGGLVNIITTSQKPQGLSVGGSFSNTSYLPGESVSWAGNGVSQTEKAHFEDLADGQNINFNIGYGAELWSLGFNAFYNRAGNHFLFTPNNVKKLRRKTGNETWNSGGKASFIYNLPDETSTLFIDGDFFYSDLNVPKGGSYSPVSNKQIDISTRQNIRLDMPIAFNDSLAMEASFSNRYGEQHFDEAAGLSTDKMDDIQFINRWTWFALDQLALNFGLDYRFDYLNSSDLVDSASKNRITRHAGGVYITTEWYPFDTFQIIPSVKLTTDSKNFVPVPKVGLVWEPVRGLIIKNNYYRSFKFPDFEDLYWSSAGYYGNPNLKAEDGYGGDIGVGWTSSNKNKWNIESTFFVQNVLNSIHWSNASGQWRPENIEGSAAMFGLDTKGGFTIPIENSFISKIDISASYQFLLTYLLCYGYDWADEKRIPYQPMHTVGTSVAFGWDSGELDISGHFESSRYADTANLNRLLPFFLLNMNLNQNINDKWAVFAAIKNLLNRQYESFMDYQMPGISLSLGFRFKY
jgi:vitamin B12 transporter